MDSKRFDETVIMTIEAVIWDFGGVFTSSPFKAFARYEREAALPEGFIRSVNAVNPQTNAWARLERSEISAAQFDDAFAQESHALGHRVRGADVLPLLYGQLRDEMVHALRLIKRRLKTGCITNNFIGLSPDQMVSSAKSDVLELFDHVIESAKVGVRKPDPRIYLMMTEALRVRPEACVYLDDLGINLKPARQLGMHTIKVDEPGPALDTLEAVLGFALR